MYFHMTKVVFRKLNINTKTKQWESRNSNSQCLPKVSFILKDYIGINWIRKTITSTNSRQPLEPSIMLTILV